MRDTLQFTRTFVWVMEVRLFPTRTHSLLFLSFFFFRVVAISTLFYGVARANPCVSFADLRRLSVVLVPFRVSFCHSWCSSPYRVHLSLSLSLSLSSSDLGGWNYLPTPETIFTTSSLLLDVVLWRCVGVKHPVAKQPDLPRLRGETRRKIYARYTHTHT